MYQEYYSVVGRLVSVAPEAMVRRFRIIEKYPGELHQGLTKDLSTAVRSNSLLLRP